MSADTFLILETINPKTENNMTKKITPKTEDAWKKCREEGIGSSEAGTILGLNKFQTLHQWWRIKTGRDPQPDTNDAMARGHEMEDAVAQGFARKTGAEIIKASAANIIYYDAEHPHRRVTPDRFCWIPDMPKDRKRLDNKFILECKTYRGHIKDGDYPRYWYVQVMYQIGVCGCPYGYIAWVDSDLDVQFVRIDFNQEDFDAICAVVDSVWETNIKQDIEPDPTNFSDIVSRFPKEDEGKAVQFDLSLANKVARYTEIAAEIKELENEQTGIKDAIALAMGDAEVAKDAAGVTLCTFKASRTFDGEMLLREDPRTYYSFCTNPQPQFDKAAFKRAMGSKVYNKYCVGIGSRTMRVKK